MHFPANKHRSVWAGKGDRCYSPAQTNRAGVFHASRHDSSFSSLLLFSFCFRDEVVFGNIYNNISLETKDNWS